MLFHKFIFSGRVMIYKPRVNIPVFIKYNKDMMPEFDFGNFFFIIYILYRIWKRACCSPDGKQAASRMDTRNT